MTKTIKEDGNHCESNILEKIKTPSTTKLDEIPAKA